MIVHIMNSILPNAVAAPFFDFMVNPSPEVYKRWLPEEHYKFYIVERSDNSPIGDLIYFDQHIGKKHRQRFYAIVRAADKPEHILFQMRKLGFNIPGYLQLDFCDTSGGLALTETIRIGFNGFGKILDPFIRLVFSKSFFSELNEHHKREWTCLADLLKLDSI